MNAHSAIVRWTTAACAAMLAFTAGGASAQSSSGWTFEATPYLWAAGMKGDVGVGTLQAEGVEASFGDIAKSLRFGFMGTFEGRKDRYGFLIDAIYMQLSQSTSAPGPFSQDVHARPTQQAYAFAGTWRVNDAPGVDIVAGVRINDAKLDLDLSSGPLAPQGRSVSKSRSWADGFVGARVLYPVAPQWALVGYVDLGGGGSDFTWQFLAGANYAISPAMTLKFGYRYLKVDYHRDDFLYDIATAGPCLGLGMRF